MGPLFWWNFWGVVAALIVIALIVSATVWVRRRLRQQGLLESSPRRQ